MKIRMLQLGSIKWFMTVFCGSFLIFILSLLHYLYSPRLEKLAWKKEEDIHIRDTSFQKKELYFYDASMKYKVIPFAFVGSEWSAATNMSVCIATQSSVTRMHSLAESLAAWKGIASVALFVPGPELQIVRLFLEHLLFCNPKALWHVSIQLVHPIQWPSRGTSLPDWKGYECNTEPRKVIDDLILATGINEIDEREQKIVYPQNILRNIAIRTCPTEWVLPVDVDMIPQSSLNRRLKKFLTSNESEKCIKCAFVLPTYEVKLPNISMTTLEKVKKIPSTKKDLLRLIKDKAARQFHIAIFKKNQEAAQLSKWEKLRSTPNDDIRVAYAANYSFWYEPTYIAKHGFPPFDERFVGYGMTRNTQAYEMFLAGYEFKILDNAFLVHWGFQQFKDRPKWREQQSTKNYAFFKKWILEKAVAYDADPFNLIRLRGIDQKKRKIKVTLDKT